VKHYQKILGITVNCVLFLLILVPSVWLLGRELATVKAELGVGREARIRTWWERVNGTSDLWRKWKYCREILALDPENRLALYWKEDISNECARKARDLMSQDQTPEAISALVLAIRVDPQVSYLWVWLEDWIKAWVEENRKPRASPRPAAAKTR